MGAVTTNQARARAVPASGRRAGITGTLRSELTKFRSVRSTYWTLILLVLVGLAWSIAFCAGTASHWSPGQRAGFDPTQSSIIGMAQLGQLVIIVLGTLAITSEYSTGMIRTSLTVMPRRGVLYGAKAAVFAAAALVVAVPTAFACFFIGQALLGRTHVTATLSQPGVLPAVIGAGLYVVLCSLFAFGLGAVLRSTAGTLTASYGVLFLLPELAKALPSAWYNDIERWLPSGDVLNAITGTQGVNHNPNLFSGWGELGVFAGYAAVMLVLGAVSFRNRDA
jgi:ABC-type transport system involved in multi-copper enzyme maturation permease subunit